MLSEYSDTFCLVLILVMSFPDICTVVITLSEFIDFFPKLWKFLIPGVLISECSDFDSSCWQNFLIPNCYQHVLILVTFLAAGVYVRSFWLLSEYVQSFCMSAACFFSYHDTSLVELVSGFRIFQFFHNFPIVGTRIFWLLHVARIFMTVVKTVSLLNCWQNFPIQNVPPVIRILEFSNCYQNISDCHKIPIVVRIFR